MFQFKFSVSQDKTPEDVASLENENTSLGLGSQKDEDEFITPKKKSKKKKHIDEENALENEKGKEIKENGINDTHEENHDTEGYNTSMMDEETLGASHKKKKKKKKDSHKESTDEAQNNSVHEENCIGSAVEDEVSDVPHKKKKKKRSNSEGTEQAQVDGAEGMKNSTIEEDNDGVPHTKKKKKKKADLDESTNENGHTEDNSTIAIEDENLVVSHKKKKKKKADLDESSERVCEENGPIDVNNISVIGDEDLEVPHKKKKKKKKADLDESSEQACEENGPIDGNNTSAFGDEDSEVPHKKKKKKKKKDDLNETLEEAQESVQTSSKKKKKRKREECEEARDDTVTENSVLEDETLVSMIKKVRQEVDDADSSSSDESERGQKNKSLQEMDTETSRTLDEGNVNDSVEPETPSNMEESGFTMINEVKEKKKSKVHHVLPEWLSNPTTVTTNLSDGLPLSDVVGMDPFLLKRLEKEKVKKFFPIQSAVIPELLASSKSVSMRYRPRDVCVSAPTGSGKTLAYALPIIQTLKSRVVPRLRALILLPTQELAKQVYSVFEKYTKFSKLKICLAVGRQNFKKEQESLVFKDSIGDCAVDILVATPGRLSDHITNTEGLSFKYLRFFVLDEADLFLSSSGGNMMLKIEQLKKQIQRPVPNNSIICGGIQPREAICLPEPYLQQILLSATLMHEPEQLKVLDLHRPKLFIASNEVVASGTSRMVMPYSRPEELKEEYVVLDSTLKPLVLYHMINIKRLRKVLVFTKSTMATHTLSVVLSAMGKRYKVAKFSSKESKRKEILADFTSGKIDVLISSDAMARGLDITHIDQVVSYDVPSLQTYVHRIGRTGRAGKKGFALSLVENTPDARRDFKTILTSCKDRLTKIEVTDKELIPYGGHYQLALATLKETLLKEKNNKKMSSIKAKLQKKKKSIEKKKAKEIV